MGLFSSSAPAPLHPVHPPAGHYPNFCVNVPTTMVLREKVFSFSGDDFSIKDTNGHTVVRCAGSAFSFRDRKVITDPNGAPLFQLHTKMFSIGKTYVGEDANEQEIFRIRKKIAFGTKMEASFRNFSTGQEAVLELRGDFLGGSAAMTLAGQPVAHIFRDFNGRELFSGQQTYFVSVAPGVDLALIAAVCICLDESREQK